MRHAEPFTSTGVSASDRPEISRRRRRRLQRGVSAGVTLLAVLVAPRTCEAAALDDGFHTDQHRLQGPSLQATLLPEPAHGLQGARLRASLADGTRVEITGFAGDVVHAHLLDASSDQALEPATPLRLHPAALVGMQWTEAACERDTCAERTFRITSAAPDESENTMPEHRSNRDTWLYRVEHTTAPATMAHDWQGACSDGPEGDMGLFVDGRWGSDGTWQGDGHTFSCPAGVIAKCARSWGYKPWKTLASGRGPVSLLPLHLACTRAARADYCGDGIPHTRAGVGIVMADDHGFNPRGFRAGDLESMFDQQGAVRVHDWRVPELAPACRPERAAAASAAGTIEVWR